MQWLERKAKWLGKALARGKEASGEREAPALPEAALPPLEPAAPTIDGCEEAAATGSPSADAPSSLAGTGDDRSVRVFVSSTFRDMQAEREELVKRIFPQLRKMCEQRGVVWGEVDLRWGVSDEQKAEGKVLPICLAEIRNCRPYFIGLLGERYGWVPDEISEELIAREPWLAEHRHRSVTELEILHGVLNDPGMIHHAFFYFRSAEYLDSLPADRQAEWREAPTVEEIALYGPDDAARRAEQRRDKLAALKQRIRSSGFPAREYSDPKGLGEMVLADLSRLVDRIFPEDSAPDPLDREAAEHEAFAMSRARTYIGRPHDFERLDAHAGADGPPLVVLGESGLGKSALLANWAAAYRAAHSGEPLVMHFVGASAASADLAAMLRRLIGELGRRLDLQLEIPSKPDELGAAFANALDRAAERGRVVLLIDALNQLDDSDRAPDLAWLPPTIPANVRLIVSALPGRALDELGRRGWPTLTIEPLQADERRRLIRDYLAQYTKTLAPAQVERLAEAPQTGNPLYLRALLEELRLFGVHELLDQRIDHYLEASAPDLLYQKILARLEEDYERDRPALVGDAFSLLWAARRGLAQTELLDMLGADGEMLPGAVWSPLYLAIEPSLVSRSGLISFFHDYLRDAVRDRYLPRAEQQAAAHVRLADFFSKAPLGPRKVDELPWQLAQARSWLRLYLLLADLTFFAAAWKADEHGIRRIWTQLDGASDFDRDAACRELIENPAERPEDGSSADMLLRNAEHLVAAGARSSFTYEMLQTFAAIPGPQPLARLGARMVDTGVLPTALSVCTALAPIFRKVADAEAWIHLEAPEAAARLGHAKAALARNLSNQAAILQSMGDMAQAAERLEESERLFDEAGDLPAAVHSRGSRAVLLLQDGSIEAGLELLEDCERRARQAGQAELLAHTLGARAEALAARGEQEGPATLYEEAKAVLGQLESKEDIARLLASEGEMLEQNGRLASARKSFKEAEALLREAGAMPLLTDIVFQLGGIEWKLRNWQESFDRYQEAFELATAAGRMDKAMEIQRTAERCAAKLMAGGAQHV